MKNSSSHNDVKRIAANMKERERVQRMNKAFVELKKVLPKKASSTKMDLLSSATDYIQHLTDVLQETFGKDIKSILNGHKLRKICGINQMMPYKELPETIFKFSVQSPKSAIPFQDETTSSPANIMNQNSSTNDWLFVSPSPVTFQNRCSLVLPQEASLEPVFKFAVQNPKSTIPFQNENISSPNFAYQEQVTDGLGPTIGPPLTNTLKYSQETTNPQGLLQPFVKPETLKQYPDPVFLPHHRVTNEENISYSNTGLGVPTMIKSQGMRQINNNTPILSDELDQFCCEIFDMLPSGDKCEDLILNLPDFPLT